MLVKRGDLDDAETKVFDRKRRLVAVRIVTGLLLWGVLGVVVCYVQVLDFNRTYADAIIQYVTVSVKVAGCITLLGVVMILLMLLEQNTREFIAGWIETGTIRGGMQNVTRWTL